MKRIRGRWGLWAVTATIGLVAGCGGLGGTASGTATPVQPYAGLQDRPIRALAPERVADLLAGRGAGYALAGELNHYPGPTHVLDMKTELGLSPEQQETIGEVFSAMQERARQLGNNLVDLEGELDVAFREGAITEPMLGRLTGRIAETEGRLRAVHLAAHIETRALLTAEQITRYDALRGYGPASDAPLSGDGPTSVDEHRHSGH